MKKQEQIYTNFVDAILWAKHKHFDPDFNGVVLYNTAEIGLEGVFKKYQNYFCETIELDTEALPEAKDILKQFDETMAIITEDHFIFGSNGIVRSHIQIFTALQLVAILKGKKAYLVKREIAK